MSSNTAANYREMLRAELAPFRVRSDADIVRVLDESWEEADANPRGWSERERGVRLLWSALGLLVFGRLDHLERALSIIRDRPDVVRDRACRYYVSALRNLLPFPNSLSPVNEPGRAIEWLQVVRPELSWLEGAGAFVMSPVAASSTADRPNNELASGWELPDDRVLSLLEATLGDELRDDEYAVAG